MTATTALAPASTTRPIGPSQSAVLAALAAGPATVAELVRECGMSPKSVSAAIDGLARRGLVRYELAGGRWGERRWSRVEGRTVLAEAALGPGQDADYLPSADEIKAVCAAIRSEWPPWVEMVRRGVRPLHHPGSGVTDAARSFVVPSHNPIATGMPSCVCRRNGRPMARRRPD